MTDTDTQPHRSLASPAGEEGRRHASIAPSTRTRIRQSRSESTEAQVSLLPPDAAAIIHLVRENLRLLRDLVTRYEVGWLDVPELPATADARPRTGSAPTLVRTVRSP